MAVKFTMKSTRELLKARGLMSGDTAQKFVDGEVLSRSAPMLPIRPVLCPASSRIAFNR